MKNSMKKLLALVLCAAMLLTLLPVNVLATKNENQKMAAVVQGNDSVDETRHHQASQTQTPQTFSPSPTPNTEVPACKDGCTRTDEHQKPKECTVSQTPESSSTPELNHTNEPTPEIFQIFGRTVISVGETESLTLRNPPKGEVVWATDNKKIATVHDGNVTGLAVGTTIITATAGGYVATFTMKVKELKPVEATPDLPQDPTNPDVPDEPVKSGMYTIRFTAGDNGSFEGTEQTVITLSSVAEGTLWSAISVPVPKAATGYRFKAWSPAFPVDETAKVTANASYTVQFEPLIYTVTFVSAGSIVGTQSVQHGDMAKEQAAPAIPADQVSFEGWQGEDGRAFDFSSPIVKDTTITASFDNLYWVKFLDAEGKVIDTRSVAKGTSVAATDKPVAPPAGTTAVFSCWMLNGEAYDFSKPVNSNLRLTPRFDNLCYVYFDSIGGTMVSTQIVAKDAKANEPERPIRPGYTFSHWSVSKDGPAFNFAVTRVTADLLLHAVWIPSMADYQIVLWVEKANYAGDPGTNIQNYSYYSSIVKRAEAGSTVHADMLTDSEKNSVSTSEGKTFATYAFGTGAAVLGDGTTTINAYFKRIPFQYEFKNAKFGEALGKTFQFKYEQRIESVWPMANDVTAPDGVSGRFARWNVANASASSDSWVTKRLTVTADMLPFRGNTVTLTAVWATLIQKHVNYWFERLPGESGGVQRTFNRTTKWYVKSEEYSQDFESLADSSLSPKAIDGMNFAGEDGNTANDTLFNFYYDRQTYMLNFNTVGGNAIEPIVKIMVGEPLKNKMPPTPQKTVNGVDFVFVDWWQDAAYQMTFDADTAVMPAHDLKLFARWESTQFYVRFFDDVSGGALLDKKGVSVNERVVPDAAYDYVIGQPYFHPDGTLIGVFKGWYWYLPGTSLLVNYGIDTPVNADIDLYACWRTDGFTVSYAAGGASGSVPVDSGTYDFGVLAPVKDGSELQWYYRTFIGWKSSTDGARYYPGQAVKMTGDVVLTAQWVRRNEATTVTYEANLVGVKETNPVTWAVEKNASVQLGGAMYTHATYVMTGWNTKSDGSGTHYALGETITIGKKAITLYGEWKKSVANYTIHYYQDRVLDDNLLGTTVGSGIIGTTVTVSAGIGEGQLDWKKPGVGYGSGVQQNAPLTITANAADNRIDVVYAPMEYSITYVYTGTVPPGAPPVPAVQSGKHSGDIISVSTLSMTVPGYAFSGWTTRDAAYHTGDPTFIMPAGNVTMTGAYTAIPYTVNTTVVNGTITPTAVKYYGENCTIRYTPNSDCYLVRVMVDGIERTEANPTETVFTNIRANHHVAVEYAKKTTLIVKADSAAKPYDGMPLQKNSFTYTGNLLAGDVITATVTGSVINVADTRAGNNTISNIRVLRGTLDVTKRYMIIPGNGTLSIAPKKVTIRVNDATKAFGAMDPVFSGSVNGLINPLDLGAVTYERTNKPVQQVGAYLNVIDATYIDNSNYDVTVDQGTFTIHPLVKYDKNTADAVSNLPPSPANAIWNGSFAVPIHFPTREDYTFVAWNTKADGTGTSVAPGGIIPSVTANITLYAQWRQVNAGYTIQYYLDSTAPGQGTLLGTVPGKAPIRSGVALTPEQLNSHKPVNGYSDGVQQGTIPFVISENAASNIIMVLYVAKGNIRVALSDKAVVYDGATHDLYDTLTITGFPEMTLAMLHGTVSGGTGTDVKRDASGTVMPYVGSITGDPIYTDTSGKQYAVTYMNANLTIQPIALEITANSAEKVYDGMPLLANGYTLTKGAFQSGHGFTQVRVDGSVTNVEESPKANIITGYVMPPDYANNYQVTSRDGTLTIRKRAVTVHMGNVSAAWGETLPTLNAAQQITSVSGLVREEDLFDRQPVYLANEPGKDYANVGLYSNQIGLTYEVTSNYTVQVILGSVTINPWLHYEGNGNSGGTAPAKANVPYRSQQTVAHAGTLYRNGHTFSVWNTEKDGRGTNYAPGTGIMMNQSVTLYAQWTVKTYPVCYAPGASNVSNMPTDAYQIAGGSMYTIPADAAPVRAGYTHIGWKTTDLGGTAQYFKSGSSFVMPGNAVNLTATWRQNGWVVTYRVDVVNADGEKIESKTHATYRVMEGKQVPLPEKPERTGFTWSGWNGYVEKMPGRALLITGKLTERPTQTTTPTLPTSTPLVPPTTTPDVTGVPSATPEIIQETDTQNDGQERSAWALLNLILVIATALASVWMLIGYFGKKKEHDENKVDIREIHKHGVARLLTLIPTICGVIAFLLTENMKNPMVIWDHWTLLMVVIAAVQFVVVLLGIKKETDIEEKEQNGSN